MNAVDQEIFDRFEYLRAELEPLPDGYRWLTTDDCWGEFGEYKASEKWWGVGDPQTAIQATDKVQPHHLCYTPRGR